MRCLFHEQPVCLSNVATQLECAVSKGPLGIVLGLELRDFVKEALSAACRFELGGLPSTLWPDPVQYENYRTAKPMTGFFGLGSLVRQQLIDQDKVGRHLCNSAALRVVCFLCRSDQQTENQGCHRRYHAHSQFHDIFCVLAQVILGQNVAEHQTEEGTSEDADKHHRRRCCRAHSSFLPSFH